MIYFTGKKFKLFLFAIQLFFLQGLLFAADKTIWWDGSVSNDNPSNQKLLSDNSGYWGDQIATGVTYSYEKEPTSPADRIKNNQGTFGRRLLDGMPMGDWHVPVGINRQPLITVFDFKRPCLFQEVDICTRSKKVSVIIEAAQQPKGPWDTILESTTVEKESEEKYLFHRFKLPLDLQKRKKYQYMRLTVASLPKGKGTTWLDEVVVWGDATVSEEYPENIKSITKIDPLVSGYHWSIKGIHQTIFHDAQYKRWWYKLPENNQKTIVVSSFQPLDLPSGAILPLGDEIIDKAAVVMTRNETEGICIALTNPGKEKTFVLENVANKISGLNSQVYAAGAIETKRFGTIVRPLFTSTNLPNRMLLQRYLTNSHTIENFPSITLDKGESVILWITVTTDNCKSGQYKLNLKIGAQQSFPITIKVFNVTLPNPDVWLDAWSNGTTNWRFPFKTDTALKREAAYMRTLGVSNYGQLPEPNTLAFYARKLGTTYYKFYGLPRKYVHKGFKGSLKPEDVTDADKEAIYSYIRSFKERAEKLGLQNKEWSIELWDEPGKGNAPIFGTLARIIKKEFPEVSIYCNPCFWESGRGFTEEAVIIDSIKSWYNDCVDISVPIRGLDKKRHPLLYKNYFDKKRAVRAFYIHPCPGRGISWEAFKRGWNGWGFYSYFAPRKDPWNDNDHKEWDYQVVYPGPNGPVPTFESESMRESWDDYRLLTFLKKKKKDSFIKKIMSSEVPYPERREQIMRFIEKTIK